MDHMYIYIEREVHVKILSVLPPDSASLLCTGLSVSRTVCEGAFSTQSFGQQDGL